MTSLLRIPPWDRHGRLQVVVEAPKGASIKREFEPEPCAFAASRTLPVGARYP